MDQVAWHGDWGNGEWHDTSTVDKGTHEGSTSETGVENKGDVQKSKTVGSLIIHAITGFVSEPNGCLVLEESSSQMSESPPLESVTDLAILSGPHPCGSSLPEPQQSGPYPSEPCLSGAYRSGTQRSEPLHLGSDGFEPLGISVFGSCDIRKCEKFICSCDECTREDTKFFQAWRKYRQELSQEEAVAEVGQGFPSQEGVSLERSLMKLVGCESCCCFGAVSRFSNLKSLIPRFCLRPLLSELNMEQDSSWWLIDSGAAVTVVSEAAFGQFQATLKSSPDVERFRAANGSKVSMKGVADISLGFAMKSFKDGRNVWKNASMQVMVGGTHHNILSTTALCRSGWTFTQWGDGAELKHDASGNLMLEVVMHSGCPWVRMYPVTSVSQVDSPAVDESFGSRVEKVVRFEHDVDLAPLSPAVEAQLEMHRKQGHFPHHPQCPECARVRSVFRHRRKAQDAIECEVQADFCFITRRGELNEEDHGRNIGPYWNVVWLCWVCSCEWKQSPSAVDDWTLAWFIWFDVSTNIHCSSYRRWSVHGWVGRKIHEALRVSTYRDVRLPSNTGQLVELNALWGSWKSHCQYCVRILTNKVLTLGIHLRVLGMQSHTWRWWTIISDVLVERIWVL